ncbi:L-Ala-D/L-Glu epimerase [Citrobacter rodentium]|uniref:Dipeptide epimerase n=2 Tax=Citrobacter rodentium TaxID=67825 RepID=D2TK93_CITRI|nr:L-Ala-D/L-Glu epimerase [Citrobacter rodentium]KIQ50083.1 L-alanine-DL-glutamate epimerase [Citrobacter rodentium]QBY28250.1 L-Ala-D/L-Glu epimerase [Citrobacter rodentium]UHO29878.1 L-Ala-D/L-Glu epimerase [Citrobacter rodentium NBRC 105723 = DSM 16636]CBG88435.1 putative mandelate racemase/muconate lactonizing family protein [Citrobacter rodentium ICC168]HAT8015251.1 L-Ala-D/L-Glu epimerase [Citrobacter rodentium NBRC 105723 = DSM 16636]
MRSVKVYEEAWPLHTPFVIARGSRSEARVVVVELEEDGVKGSGECTPYPRYGESDASVLAQIMSIVPQLEKGLTRQQLQQLLPAGAARNAVDCALWDLSARQQQQTLAEYTGVTLNASVTTAQTVVIGTPEQMAASAAALWEAGARLLKVKLDDRLISERIVAIRSAAPEATLIVDANESWRAEGLAARCQLLADLGVAMLEQPLPAQDDVALENFIHPLPICADESCHTRSSLKALRGRYEMINIKLDKTGGLTEALALATEAQAQGFALMLGCMLCTSRAIAAALPLTPQVTYADLDGPTWLAVDVEPALRFTTGQLHL